VGGRPAIGSDRYNPLLIMARGLLHDRWRHWRWDPAHETREGGVQEEGAHEHSTGVLSRVDDHSGPRKCVWSPGRDSNLQQK